ncbi:MAG TPA: sensor histidine kinase, partial [Burkholderiaceae bacterium]
MSIKPSRLAVLVLAWIVVALAVSALAARLSYQHARDAQRDDAAVQLAADAQALESALEKYETLPFVIALHPLVAAGLQAPADAPRIAALDRYLAEVQRRARVAAAYVILPSGLTIAASNYDTTQSFVGNNYRFRPYMGSALAGRTGRFYGIGATTGEPGYFLGQPVFGPAPAGAGTPPVIGVVVIKIDLADAEKSWPPGGDEPVALADGHGVVFLANVASWKYRSLAPLSDDARREIRRTQQYAGKDVAALVPADHRWPL